MNGLTLICPGLEPKNRGFKDYLKPLSLIDEFYIRSRKKMCSWMPHHILAHLLGLPTTEYALPLAYLYGLYDGIEGGDHHLLLASPVYLTLDHNAVYLLEDHPIVLSQEDCQTLAQDFNQLFSGDGLELLALTPERWYLKTKFPPDLISTPLPEMSNRNISHHLPEGENKHYWSRLFSEVQMFLHTHPVNQERLIRGEKPVNALWFWGDGSASSLPEKFSCSAIISEDPLFKGLALHYGIPVSTPHDLKLNEDKAYLFYINRIDFESTFLTIWQTLKKSYHFRFELYDGYRHCVQTPWHRLLFWKRRYKNVQRKINSYG